MLKYVGRGASLPGVPARDLSDEEVKQYDEKFLLRTGLYERPREARAGKDNDLGPGKVSPVRQAVIQDTDGT